MAFTFEFDPGELESLISAAVNTFDFELPGSGGQTLGRDLAVRVAHQIQERSNEGKDPEGRDWTPNERRYAAYKQARYAVDRPGELGGQMLSLQSLVGNPVITPDKIVMSYGLNVPPGRGQSRTGTELKPWESRATDRQKAEWFEAGGREFYALNEADEEELLKLAEEALGRHLDALG